MQTSVQSFLEDFALQDVAGDGKRQSSLFGSEKYQTTAVDYVTIRGTKYPRYTNEFWTARQRQSNSLHEISYRACFKAQLPRFFVELFTQLGDTVYDPFGGRGTTAIESAILGRNVISNDINPLSAMLTIPRLRIPDIKDVEKRLQEIPVSNIEQDIDLSMFYHAQTLKEIISLRQYLKDRRESGLEDEVDSWIRMVATNRLTGHSAGFFSVYTLPPNQAVSQDGQRKINIERKQIPEYRSTSICILRKTRTLLTDVSPDLRRSIRQIGEKAKVITGSAAETPLDDESVDLTVTSPPFLSVIDYAGDNWLRLWFNGLDAEAIASRITVVKTVDAWSHYMTKVFHELYRITRKNGWVAFEVGEVNSGKIRLDEVVIPIGEVAGFKCHGVVINQQEFTKTANIWGVSNNKRGTNTNRIVLLEKQIG